MYILEKANNTITPATKCSFSDLNFTERNHLQEWIAKEPSALGEELLIIQKEFDGFSDTKERLDLLALDKKGRLVIIENKLDDSGRDVTWQAIKYASYCSSFSKQQIIEIFSKYLGDSQKAVEEILSFFEIENIDDIELNAGDNTQRIFFVAGNFRKEVTSSVLWLANFGLEIKCFKVTPYKYGDRVLIEFDQIIPIKDAEDYIIRMAAKTQEASQASTVVEGRHVARKNFWKAFVEYNSQHNGPFASTSTAGTDNWIGKSIGVPGLSVNVVITYQNCRSEIYFNSVDQEKNKARFDFCYDLREELQSEMPEFSLVWERLDNKVGCRIRTDLQLSYLEEENLPKIMEFLLNSSKKLIEVFGKYNKQIVKV